MDLGLAGKCVAVTGGTGGLGLAAARTLLGEGANVVVSGRSEERFAGLRPVWGEHADRVAFAAGDNADADLPARISALALGRWGRLDGLLVSVGGPPAGRALTTGDAAWRDAFEGIFLGAVRLVRDLAPALRPGSAILLVLAISAKEASPVFPISNGLRPGLAMLVKSFADELGPADVRVNALLPNLFATDRIRKALGDGAPPVEGVALGRVGEPEEFGRMAAVLLSPASSYVTGAAIPIDGGRSRVL